MTRWRIRGADIIEGDKEFTATFQCTNGETGVELTVAITQPRGTQARDMVGALRAAAELLRQAASNELEPAKLDS